MRKLLLLLIVIFTPAPSFSGEPAAAAGKMSLQEGDLIFIHSASSQAPAIEEVMGSSWTHVGAAVMKDSSWFVAEAAATVRLTPLPEFLARSRGGEYLVKRFGDWGKRPAKKDLSKLKKRLLAELGKKYDIYFEWSDSALYCSEYVWKAYNSALKKHPELSKPQKFSDLKLDGPLAQELIDKRYKAAGKELKLDEPIVTPLALLNSDLLITVPQQP
ncbi:MAG: YiiX/YebB-like N1pC/P60 family cysteine hydrolase [Elusimicrobiota bacterium]